MMARWREGDGDRLIVAIYLIIGLVCALAGWWQPACALWAAALILLVHVSFNAR